MRDSLFFFSIFILGIVCGYFLDSDNLNKLDLTLPPLWLLMALTGITLGADSAITHMLKKINPALLLLPAATTAGSLAGACLATLFLSLPLLQCLAIGAGFGYYSLSSVFIGQFMGSDAGTIALLCNIFRESFALLTIPVLLRIFGPLAAISSGGATTMDTTLPLIVHHAGIQWTIAAIVHGSLLDISVPFWLSLFCKL